jgi:asparagine synthase (glutamine-hydrolysing)
MSIRAKAGQAIENLWKWHRIGSKVSQIIKSSGGILATSLILRQLYCTNVRTELLEQTNNNNFINGVPMQAIENLASDIKNLDIYSQISLIEMRLYLANMLLRDGDVMSMAHGLEVRVPFLDHKLVEYVFSLPSVLKNHRNLPKPLLLQAVGDLLPKQIYLRPKMGFVFPWEIWIKNQLRSQIEKTIYEFTEENELGLNMKNCRNLWQMFLQGGSKISWAQVWAVYVLLEWYRVNLGQ